jgi:hypothetical protein
MIRRSGNGGTTWGSTRNLSADAGWSTSAVLAVGGTNVHVGWTSDNATPDILYRRSVDTGLSYNAALNLSSNSGSSGGLQLLSVGHDVYAVWSDDSSGNFEILLATTAAGGFMAAPITADGAAGWADGAPNPSVPAWGCPPKGAKAAPPAPSPQPAAQARSLNCGGR